MWHVDYLHVRLINSSHHLLLPSHFPQVHYIHTFVEISFRLIAHKNIGSEKNYVYYTTLFITSLFLKKKYKKNLIKKLN